MRRRLKLAPMTYEMWPGWVLTHGERDEPDPTYPDACLCGEPDYLQCEGWLNDNLGTVTIGRGAA